MKRIHIVGKQGSFTHGAAKERYPIKFNPVPYASHHDLVTALIEGKISGKETSIVPLWNSNTGLINMRNVTETTKVFDGQAGRIFDLWPHEIEFRLAIQKGSLQSTSKVFSVHVAEHQCSRFFRKNDIAQKNGRFISRDTTTEAMDKFLVEGQENDAVLCGEALLEQYKLKSLPDIATNPNNMTIFAAVGNLPIKAVSTSKYCLGCFTSPIEGHELPVEFLEYYERLVQQTILNQKPTDVIVGIPKILFIVRDLSRSNVLMLLEMPSGGETNANWESPDITGEIKVSEVGGLQVSYTAQAAHLMRERFSCDNYRFYGDQGAYIWMCPALMISVHGYDKDLVRESARMQVLQLKALVDAGYNASPEAKKILKLAKDLNRLGLSPDSIPEAK